MKYNLKSFSKKILADTITPVSVYLRLRDKFPNSLLLESSDYHANENAYSYICFQPIASIKVQNDMIFKSFPDGMTEEIKINPDVNVAEQIQNFANKFSAENHSDEFINNGLFGYLSYDAVQYFENIQFHKKENNLSIPDIYYAVYQNIIALNHFNNEAHLFCHSLEDKNNLDEILGLLRVKSFAEFAFERDGEVESNMTDDDFMDLVKTCKSHCQRGDVFQIVASKRFKQKFKGDEFNVYRSLRSVNPSPYLFFFDYGDFKIFGSSPEAQLVVKNGMAEIHPIAGTVKRTGNDEEDAKLAKQLSKDEKEKSEHVMLVDLARNDLS